MESDSEEALMVSCADKIHNMFSFILEYKSQGEGMWQHFNAPKEELLWFNDGILRVMKARLKNPIVGELESLSKEFKKMIEK